VQSELDALMEWLGAWGYPGLGVAAFIEYLFPPFPGDTVTVLGGAWAAREDRSYVLVHLLLTLGSVVGMAVTWRLGRALAGSISRAPAGSRLFGLNIAQIHKAQALMRTRGDWVLLSNRFLPSFRSVLFIAAGAAEVPLWRTLLLGTISAATFNGILLAVGAALGNNAEKITQFFHQFRIASLSGLGVVVLLLGGRFLWRRGQAKSRT
jgi:membrane protein DedA with SNARE-associated domain